jgi:DNA primase
MAVSVADLLERLEIVPTKRAGDRVWARCPHPEHDDRDPSWWIVDDPGGGRHGRHHCFGCGWGGGPEHLVMAVLGLGRSEARSWIRSGAQAPLPTGICVEVGEVRSGVRRFQLPSGVRIVPLDGWPGPARRYAERRGVTAEQVERWGIGYAADGKLAGRIVFPVRRGGGAPVGYSARTFVRAPKRYITPDRDEGADRDALFGEQHWPQVGADGYRAGGVVVVEGALDGLAVERAAGVSFGAMSGSQPSPGLLGRLATFERVVMASDNDAAGNGVAEVARCLARWTTVLRAELPPGVDCCALECEDRAELARVLESAR